MTSFYEKAEALEHMWKIWPRCGTLRPPSDFFLRLFLSLCHLPGSSINTDFLGSRLQPLLTPKLFTVTPITTGTFITHDCSSLSNLYLLVQIWCLSNCRLNIFTWMFLDICALLESASASLDQLTRAYCIPLFPTPYSMRSC